MANASQNKLLLWMLPVAFFTGAIISQGPTPSPPAKAAVREVPNAMMQIPVERPLSDDAVLARFCERHGASTETACMDLIRTQVDIIAAHYQVRTDNIINVPPYCVERGMITSEELFVHFKDHVHEHASHLGGASLRNLTLDMLTATYPCPRGPKGFEEVTMSRRRG
ncbi:hypothetical protein FV228_01495 [Methylobacterium sp. WL18]|uniref:hypothetical protein n=1 Tax=Methylobacterium sp. WL18 TaxID=2603897 RepID=UPI0011CC2797|nr:hypothetical protein [Methylobacterium sp. WL18]TXN76064.1 hypothetical protein FV228_01495 [Methylobacterium sp. WL18]